MNKNRVAIETTKNQGSRLAHQKKIYLHEDFQKNSLLSNPLMHIVVTSYQSTMVILECIYQDELQEPPETQNMISTNVQHTTRNI
jgi:hypothetical protein